jgi:hypothetical protein
MLQKRDKFTDVIIQKGKIQGSHFSCLDILIKRMQPYLHWIGTIAGLL